MMTNQISTSENAFDIHSDEYDRWFDAPEGKALFTEEAEAVRLLMNGLDRPFLEIGVGTGRFAEALGIEFGVDPSRRALELAQRRGIIVEQGQGESLPYNDDYFGAAFILFTICFVKDPLQAIIEARRVLKQNGRLIIGIINRDSLWGRRAMIKGEEGHPLYKHARFYGADDVTETAESAGFTVEGYASALLHSSSSGAAEREEGPVIKKGLLKDAGFICIRFRKS